VLPSCAHREPSASFAASGVKTQARETVWKLRTDSILWSHELAEWGERAPFAHFAPPRNVRSD
jgi:hypothetical protein